MKKKKKRILNKFIKEQNLPIVFNFLTIEKTDSAYDLVSTNKVIKSEKYNTSFYNTHLLDTQTLISEYDEELFKFNE